MNSLRRFFVKYPKINDEDKGEQMQLGFIGLGHLGKAIAGRLNACGHTLTVYNRTAGKEAGLECRVAASPKEVAQEAEVIFICLFDSAGVDTVLGGDNGILEADLSGKIVIDLTTNHYNDAPRFHASVKKSGGSYLEAPVLGSVVPATNGALTVLVSGEKRVYDAMMPLFEDIGQNIFYLGEAGRASKMKLVNNLALGSIMAVLSESLALGEAAGIAKKDILDILAVDGGKSLVLDAKKQKLLDEDFSTHFSNALIYKDLHCLQDLAYELKKPLFTAATVKELFGRTFEAGIDQEDFSSIYKLFKKEQ